MPIKAWKLPSEQSQNRPNQTSTRKAITRPSINAYFLKANSFTTSRLGLKLASALSKLPL
ncbi:hypothetical protein BGY98DRAFT_1104227 [Russula aff. rugulosa BPL654]|nr:hypothetical protein BGY98DRAFT_1104227 [Russula aff. rugulosa BPL654]